MMRKGAEDYETLWLLQQRIASLAPAQRDGPLGKGAASFLEHVADAVAGVGSELETSGAPARSNTQSQLLPHRLREEAADWIERLAQ
jgi:hypothetical protein